jgi:hypothetical protein
MDSNQTRRNLIKFIPGALLVLCTARGNAAALADHSSGGQNPPAPPPYPFGPDGELKVPKTEILGNGDKPPATPPPPHKDLKADDRDLHKQVALLAQYADELKKEVDKTDATKVLSVDMLRKTQTIEKLAKHIASLAGS